MREEILKRLSLLSEEEIAAHAKIMAYNQKAGGKRNRRIIERRAISTSSYAETTSPVFLRAHPRFVRTPEHTHDYVEIMYVCSGSITHKISEETVTVSAGDLIILGRSTKHSILPSSSSDIGINIIISSDLFEIILNTVRRDSTLSTKHLLCFLDGETTRYKVFHCEQSVEVANIMENMIYSSFLKQQSDEYLLEQSIRILLCYLCGIPDTVDDTENISYTDKTKKKIIKYVRTSYSTATLTEGAQMLGLSPTYLSRWIRKHFGMSFKDLLLNERFSVACDLLRTTDTPIGEIIVHIGYENSSYFHKEFKKRFGMTPNSYRKLQ